MISFYCCVQECLTNPQSQISFNNHSKYAKNVINSSSIKPDFFRNFSTESSLIFENSQQNKCHVENSTGRSFRTILKQRESKKKQKKSLKASRNENCSVLKIENISQVVPRQQEQSDQRDLKQLRKVVKTISSKQLLLESLDFRFKKNQFGHSSQI